MLRLIIADDHPLLIDGLKRVLEEIEGAVLMGSAANGLQLIDLLRRETADIVLLDLQMPKMDGVEVLKVLRTEFPKLRVLVFTNYHQPQLIKEIKALGASGYLLKTSTSVTIKEAVAALAAGRTWFQEEGGGGTTSSVFTDEFMKKYQLTNREIEIIRKIAEGLTTKEIASLLFVSEFTINSHRRNICRKLDIYTPVGLINFAREHGLMGKDAGPADG